MNIHTSPNVLTTTGPTSGAPHLVVLNQNHSSIKCTNATPYVHIAKLNIASLSRLYAAYSRTTAVKNVHVPNVRAESSVACERVRSKPLVSWLGLGGGELAGAAGPQ